MMKRELVAIVCYLNLFLFSGIAQAAGEGTDIDVGEFHLALNDQASLQRGARNFVNTCSGCHSMQFMRYDRIAKDIGITQDNGEIFTSLLQSDLMFNTDSVTDSILSAIPTADAAEWFGAIPPDLSLIARSQSPTWLYQYLMSFYSDESRPWGVNNTVFPDVGMPHVLLELQGEQEPIFHTAYIDVNGEIEEVTRVVGFNLTKPGLLSPEEYQEFVSDLVNFITYAAEPGRQDRERLGVWVILFLVIILAFCYLLKREYWKDIH